MKDLLIKMGRNISKKMALQKDGKYDYPKYDKYKELKEQMKDIKWNDVEGWNRVFSTIQV
jgi:hypothetical protein